ncbi:MAG: response regulator [Thermodesulfobacteriota bacterium]
MAADKKIKILLVDDFATMRHIIRKNLRQRGFTNIVEADDGATAVAVLQQEKIELIISDWQMPKMNGLELLKHVRGHDATSAIPFILLISEAQQEEISQGVTARVNQYIVKPFTAETLGEKLDKIFT